MILSHNSFLIFVAHIFLFDNFTQAFVLRVFKQHNYLKYFLINWKSLFITHTQRVYFSAQNTRVIVERHSYRTQPSLSVSRNILSEETLKPLAIKFVVTGISNFKNLFSSIPLPDTVSSLHQIHKTFLFSFFFLKIFLCKGLLNSFCLFHCLNRSSLIHNLEFQLLKTEKNRSG